MDNYVFVIDTRKQPAQPCTAARARELLDQKKAAIYRYYPFTIILNRAVEIAAPLRLELKIDPGSKTTGLALVLRGQRGARVIWAAHLEHRGNVIANSLSRRAAWRRNRRGRARTRRAKNRRSSYRSRIGQQPGDDTRRGNSRIRKGRRRRYRACRPRMSMNNQALRRDKDGHKMRWRKPKPTQYRRAVPQGWQAPSTRSRVANIVNWARKLMRYVPITHLVYENVKFDTQLLRNPDIQGAEYQHGTLSGYEKKEYLAEQWDYTCAFCGQSVIGKIWEVEHLHPQSRGGSHAMSNLVLACRECNSDKGARTAQEYLRNKPEVLARIARQQRKTLRAAAEMNKTRWVIWQELKKLGLPVNCGSGGRTKFNRYQQHYPKAHWIDAACVGTTGRQVSLNPAWRPLTIKAKGRGSRQKANLNKYGFPTAIRMRQRRVHGFQWNDIVYVQPSARSQQRGIGHIASCRKSGSFTIRRIDDRTKTFSAVWKRCTLLQRADGYEYSYAIQRDDEK